VSMSLHPTGSRPPLRSLRAILRPLLAGALGVATAALMVACGSSGKGLLAASEAGPLRSDIEAVDVAAQEGNGDCTATDAALQRTEQDFAALPPSVDSGLHSTLGVGIKNLRKVATELCAQPLAATTTTQTTSTAATTTTSTGGQEREAKTEKAKEEQVEKAREEKQRGSEETEQSPGQGGGTPAPGEGNGKAPGEGVGGVTPEEGAGKSPNGAGGQESGK